MVKTIAFGHADWDTEQLATLFVSGAFGVCGVLMYYFNMLTMVEQNRPPETSLNQISDEELAMRMVADLMKEWPEMVVAMASSIYCGLYFGDC